MHTKKVLSLMLVTSVLVLGISAIAVAQAKRELIVIGHRVHLLSATAEQAGAMGINLLDKFEKMHPGVKVIYETYPTQRILEKFTRLGPLKESKEDLIHLPVGGAIPSYMEKFLVPLDSYSEAKPIEDYPEDYPEGLLPITRVNESIYTIPIRVCYIGVNWVNTKILMERGIEVKPTISPHEFNDIARKCTYIRPTGEKVFGHIFRGTVGYLYETIDRVARWHGGKMITLDFKCVINEPPAVKGTKLLQKLYQDGIIPPEVHTFDYAEETKFFMENRIAIGTGTTTYGTTYNDPTKSKIAGYAVMSIMAFPEELQDRELYGIGQLTYWNIGVLKGSQNKDLAWEYIRFLTSKESVLSMGLSGTTPPRMSVLRSPQYMQNNPAAAIEAQVAPWCEVMCPAFEHQVEVLDLIGIYGQDILYKGAPVQETLDQLAEEIKAYLP